MNKNKEIKTFDKLYRLGLIIFAGTLSIVIFVLFLLIYPNFWDEKPVLIEKIALQTKTEDFGLIDAEGVEKVIQHCTTCHAAKMITQNRATRQGWLSMIRWMQSTQNLWNLAEDESIILTYLSNNYGPQKKGRRSPLLHIEWYNLENINHGSN